MKTSELLLSSLFFSEFKENPRCQPAAAAAPGTVRHSHEDQEKHQEEKEAS